MHDMGAKNRVLFILLKVFCQALLNLMLSMSTESSLQLMRALETIMIMTSLNGKINFTVPWKDLGNDVMNI